MKKYSVAVIPGDGIGNEVVPEGQKVLEAAARLGGDSQFEWLDFDWSCERFAKTGRMMPKDGLDQIRQPRRDLSRRGRLSRACRTTSRSGGC